MCVSHSFGTSQRLRHVVCHELFKLTGLSRDSLRESDVCSWGREDFWLLARLIVYGSEPKTKERVHVDVCPLLRRNCASLISLWRLQILFLSLILFVEVSQPYFSFFHSFRLFFSHETDDYDFFLSEVVEKIRPREQTWTQAAGDFLSPERDYEYNSRIIFLNVNDIILSVF